MQTGSGTFIAFATEPDSVAADGSGRNSPFTTALLKHIDQPGQSISDMMIAVRNDVLAATGGHQRPWESSSLTDRFAFTPDPVRDASSLRKLPEQVVGAGEDYLEQQAYQQAVEVGSCGAYEAFGRRYPDSFYAELARERAKITCAAPEIRRRSRQRPLFRGPSPRRRSKAPARTGLSTSPIARVRC